MTHVEVAHVDYGLPDGRMLLHDVSFRVPSGSVAAIVGPNGSGKTTLLRMIAGEVSPDEGSIVLGGSFAYMRQFVAQAGDATVRNLLVEVSDPMVRAAVEAVDACELALMDDDVESNQLAYAHALANFGDAGGYEAEVRWDEITMAALGEPFAAVRWRLASSLSGGERKRLVLESYLRGPEAILLLDEPDNSLDVPTKQWLERRLRETDKTVILISHDRELLREVATHVVSVELGAAGNSAWVHGGGFATFAQARADRFARLEELRRRWDEQHAQLKTLVVTLRTKAAYNDGLASRYQAAQTRLAKFEAAGPPTAVPRTQQVRMRLGGSRTAKRAVTCTALALDGLTSPFDAEAWFGERIAILGPNGSGKSHLLRLLAAGGTDPEPEHRPFAETVIQPVRHSGVARLGSRVRPGWFAQNLSRADLHGRTLLEILHRGDGLAAGQGRAGMGRPEAARALDRYELAAAGEQQYQTLSGGQQARFQILILELSGVNLLLLDEPTDNLDLASAQALEDGLAAFEGTVLAVTHDRWFARGFDRFWIFRADGSVVESVEADWSLD
jgi:ATPase subunit of ABC transporter with duplicated ATPase domains